MAYREFHYRWEWQFESSPEQLWPLVADTNRFDRDAGLPGYVEDEAGEDAGLTNSRRRLRIQMYGVPLDYVEEPFEWIRPYRFGIIRNYHPAPIPFVQPLAQTRALAELHPRSDGGTHLIYQIWARPRNLLGYLAIPLQIGFLYARNFDAVFREYDRVALANQSFLDLPAPAVRFPPGGQQRIAALQQSLIEQGVKPDLVERLVDTITRLDDLTLDKIRRNHSLPVP